jgi:hypothetical protein
MLLAVHLLASDPTVRTAGYTRAGAASSSSSRRSLADWWSSLKLHEKILFVLLSAILWLGTCVIVGRSHPEWPLAARILSYVLLLAFYDIYLLWFCLRLVIAQARREPSVYSKLPRYAPILGAAAAAPSKASKTRA